MPYLFNLQLYKGADDKGEGGEQPANGHLLQWAVKESHFGHQRVDGVLEDGNHQNDQQWVDHLNLVRLNSEGAAHLAVHPRRLKRPPTGLLVKQCPEDGQRQVEEEDGHQSAHVVDGFALKKKF